VPYLELWELIRNMVSRRPSSCHGHAPGRIFAYNIVFDFPSQMTLKGFFSCAVDFRFFFILAAPHRYTVTAIYNLKSKQQIPSCFQISTFQESYTRLKESCSPTEILFLYFRDTQSAYRARPSRTLGTTPRRSTSPVPATVPMVGCLCFYSAQILALRTATHEQFS
jgi:hypothetical protein